MGCSLNVGTHYISRFFITQACGILTLYVLNWFEETKILLYFLSFPDTKTMHVVKIFLGGWEGSFNSLATGRCGRSFKSIIFKLIIQNSRLDPCSEIALRWMPQDITDDKSILVQIMAWCHEARSHYLSQYWPRSMLPYDITRSQWIVINPTFWISWLMMTQWCKESGHQQSCYGPSSPVMFQFTHLPLNKMAAFLQTIFSNAFLWMKSFVFWLKFHWILFLRVQLIISQHWFR